MDESSSARFDFNFQPRFQAIWWDNGNVSPLTGGSLGFNGAKAELEFVVRPSPDQLTKRAIVILIDGDGSRHKQEVDFAKVLR